MRNRVLIFAQSSQTIDVVCQLVLSSIEGLTYDRYDGRVSDKERERILHNFKKEDGKDVLILTTQIGGLGLDLPVANIVIFVENSWNPKEDDQAMDRAHRLGQRRQVTVFNLATAGTIEVRILDTQKRKRKMIDVVINDENKFLGTMNVDGVVGIGDEEAAAKSAPERKMTQKQVVAMAAEDTSYNEGQYSKDDY
jgi:SNF2 family DNA or RNA helicase